MNAVTMLEMKLNERDAEIARLTAALHANRCHPDYEYTTGIDVGGIAAVLAESGFEPNPEHQCAPGDECWRRRRTP
jgi:hypothetical protein